MYTDKSSRAVIIGKSFSGLTKYICDMNKNWEIGITVLTAISVVLIVGFYVYPVSGDALNAIYIFDFLVVVLLVVDFYKRFKESNEGIKFILKHCYELPSMIPLFVFGIIETQAILGATLRGLRLIRLFRLLKYFQEL